jgi:hypothetical protein
MSTKKLTVTIEGEGFSDLVEALREVQRLVDDEFTSGHDRNETGSYSFSVEEK